MAIIRSFDKPFELVDYTPEILEIPNTWGLINQLGIFQSEGVSQHTITLEKRDQHISLISDRVRGERNNMNKDDDREIHAFSIPHFPFDDAIKPDDIQGKRAYGDPDAAETIAAVRARKLVTMRRNYAVTLEYARYQAITAGTVYAPNGTVNIDWYASFGVSRKQVAFDLPTATTNVIAKIEEIIAHIQDNLLTGMVVSDMVGLCSPEFFAALINHATVKEAYKYYSSQQEPLRNRLGIGRFRTFDYAGMTFIEDRGSYNGTRNIPVDKAYFLPRGEADLFETYYSPAHRFDFVNTMGEEMYAFEFANQTNTEITMQAETNFVNMLRRPQVVVEATKNASF